MGSMFAPATRRKLKLRMAICAPAGYGKSWTATVFAGGLATAFGNGHPLKIAAIDTEHGALSKYAGVINGVQFDVCELQHFAPSAYTMAIREAAAAGYGVLIIDSLSHAWAGVGGALAQVDQKSGAGGNSFTAWKDVTPQHNELVEAILAFPGHVIATMRTKMEYVLEETTNSKGKTVMAPKKIGMKPVQREGMDYEFDIVADMDEAHTLIIGKTRCSAIDGQKIVKPGVEFLSPVIRWLDEGIDAPAAPAFVPSAPAIPSVTAATSAGLIAASNGAGIEKATDLQISEINIAIKALELTATQPAQMCTKRGVSTLAELSKAQADEILTALRTKMAAKKKELDGQLAAADRETTQPDPTKVFIPTVPQSSEVKPDSGKDLNGSDDGQVSGIVMADDLNQVGTIDATDATRIVDYCTKLQIDNAGLSRILAKRLTPQGTPTRSVPDLSFNHAQEILANMRAAYAKRYPDEIPF